MRGMDYILIFFVLVLGVGTLFGIGNKINNEYGVTVNETWNENPDHYLGQVKEGNNITNEIIKKSPGGIDGGLSGSAEAEMMKAGWSATGLIFKAPKLTSKIIMGDNSTTSIGSRLFINPVYLQFASMVLIVGLGILLLGTVLRNKL